MKSLLEYASAARGRLGPGGTCRIRSQVRGPGILVIRTFVRLRKFYIVEIFLPSFGNLHQHTNTTTQDPRSLQDEENSRESIVK